jgi:single-strand DNA-binding protein
VGEFVQKSSKLYIEGRLQSSSWEDRNNGDKKHRTEIVACEIVLVGSPERSSDADRHTPEAEKESVDAGTGEKDDSDIPF